jgi:hypothetical protein
VRAFGARYRRFEDAVHGLPARVIGVTFSDTS